MMAAVETPFTFLEKPVKMTRLDPLYWCRIRLARFQKLSIPLMGLRSSAKSLEWLMRR